MRLISTSPEETRRLGQALGRLLNTGTVVGLIGELGAGKTVFAQGLALGLGVGPDEYVSSPSFTLVNQYSGRVPVFHIDTYRLTDAADMVALGYEDYFDPNGVAMIEWADKVRDLLPETCILVHILMKNHSTRDISIELLGTWPSQKRAEILTSLDQWAA
jgi:tRNA threonylcarbamoyladenosine biosynthesis protein TsaE